jgi:hypothetical protein
MIRPPSNQKPYDEFWSGDPAFVQPPEGDDEATVARRKEHFEKVRRARQTGDWCDLLIAGMTPTKFIMRPIRGDAMRWLHDHVNISDPVKALGDGVLLSLAFRAALVDIVNYGADFKMQYEDHESLGTIAAAKIANDLDAVHISIVTELGAIALTRTRLNPL